MHVAGIYALVIGVPGCMCFAVVLGIARRWLMRRARQQNGEHLEDVEDDMEDFDPWVLDSELKRKGLRGVGARLGRQTGNQQTHASIRSEGAPLGNSTSAALELELAEATAMPPAREEDEGVEDPSDRDGAEKDEDLMKELDRAAGLDYSSSSSNDGHEVGRGPATSLTTCAKFADGC